MVFVVKKRYVLYLYFIGDNYYIIRDLEFLKNELLVEIK